MHKQNITIIQGGEGSDKIVAGNQYAFQKVYGEDQDDIIYGGDGGTTSEHLFGDYELEGIGTPLRGGNDKIYGGNDMVATQTIAGGTFDDQIWSGSNVSGDIKIYGDNDSTTPLTEDATTFNINDGDDLI